MSNPRTEAEPRLSDALPSGSARAIREYIADMTRALSGMAAADNEPELAARLLSVSHLAERTAKGAQDPVKPESIRAH